MRRWTIAIVLAGLVATGCGTGADPLPAPAPLRSALRPDPGFVIKPRPGCSADVIAAMGDANAISRLAAREENFTCGPASDPLPLDEAVMGGRPEVVRALLKAHTDPNARWSWAGDRFPLQEAIEARSYGKPTAHRLEIIRMLLQHGADPNARWCFRRPLIVRVATSHTGATLVATEFNRPESFLKTITVVRRIETALTSADWLRIKSTLDAADFRSSDDRW